MWIFSGRTNILVTKDDAAYYDYYAQVAIEFGVDEPPLPRPAVLSAIIRICDEDFCLASSNGPISSACSLEHNILTCLGEAPEHPVLAADYGHFMHNLGMVMNDAPLTTRTVYAPARIKFYHDLLEGIFIQLRPISLTPF